MGVPVGVGVGMRVGVGAVVAGEAAPDELEDGQSAHDEDDGRKETQQHVRVAMVLTTLVPILHYHHTLRRPKKVEAKVELADAG